MAYGTFKQYRIQTEIDPVTYFRVIEVRVDPNGIESELFRGEFKTFFKAQTFIKFCEKNAEGLQLRDGES